MAIHKTRVSRNRATTSLDGGRTEQKRRTRARLLDACNRLVEAGQTPTVEAAAEEAGVSRATAYRYFPSVDGLVSDAFFQRTAPRAEELFADRSGDPVERSVRAGRAMNAYLAQNEAATRMFIRALNEAWLKQEQKQPFPRLGRRLPLMEEAISPAADRLAPEAHRRLLHALALTTGTEAVLALRDVCGLEDEELLDTAAWATRALVRQALLEAEGGEG